MGCPLQWRAMDGQQVKSGEGGGTRARHNKTTADYRYVRVVLGVEL